MKSTLIINQTTHTQISSALLARTFSSRLLGLMFKKDLSEDGGIIIVEDYESRLNSSIHMLFMNFDICAIWLDKNFRVCDIQLAKKWHFAYIPKQKAQYVLELHKSKITYFSLGNQIIFSREK
ncbi:MAG: DUF192 domain-containing protein [Chloroflexi bacterium]|nr:DUF192 domain-containing protein [Chloroflexota bacterium]